MKKPHKNKQKCICGFTEKATKRKYWVVTERKQSSGNGMARNVFDPKFKSDYSTVKCTKCGNSWRTNANYVAYLENAK